jgi:prepilin signal peptidase PulO-like enzyme (type II secretory pathway)
MRTFLYLIGTCFISTGAYLGALNSHYILTGYAIAFSVWALFFWSWDRRARIQHRHQNYRQWRS